MEKRHKFIMALILDEKKIKKERLSEEVVSSTLHWYEISSESKDTES
jgi:hypothetical protein